MTPIVSKQQRRIPGGRERNLHESLDGRLAISFRGICSHLIAIFIGDIRQMPALMDFDVMPVKP
jgi:hypothetical protein